MSEDRGDEGGGAERAATGLEPVRSRRANPLLLTAVLLAAMTLYYFLIAWRGFYLLMEDRWILKVLGVAVLVLPLISVQVVLAQLRFGVSCQLLAIGMREARLFTEAPVLPRLPSGQLDREATDAWFDRQRSVVERAPQDWRAWFRLAQAYDLAGDRKRAREAIRTAIEKSKQRG
ncbi:MAG TPA: tetratricopeptide repeat protein [Jatrophihabitans sp.]|uniref:tetratricopeptide repeat protein n=1 Tax=Jatrophihabitans sp. TaxID=1932789 RepID=UPI002F210505